MSEASPFFQQLVRLYAYTDFARTVAGYYKEASRYNQQHFLLFDGYNIFRDRWPASSFSASQFYDEVHKAIPYVHPIHLGHDKYWFDEFNLQQDRRNRISLQEYASRGGLGFLTFPEDCTCGCGQVGDVSSNDDSDSSEENCSDTDEGDHQTTEPEWLRRVESLVNNEEDEILDASLPKSRRRKVKLGPWS